MGKRAATVHGFPVAAMGPVAKCKACGRAAMVPVSDDALEDALRLLAASGRAECPMECAYCGAKALVSGRQHLDHAVMHGTTVRASWKQNIEDERAKVARLAEGRW